tara:strand:- start:1887 stop:2720 length:834 start_codon:yes stop_codon:yes gene_type:complete
MSEEYLQGTPQVEPEGEATYSEQPVDENPHWASSFTDENLSGLAQNKGWADPEAMAKSYKDLEAFRGASEEDLIRVPKGEETWDSVYNKMGRPEKFEDYVINVPEGQDTAFSEQAKEKFFEAGMSAENATKLGDWWNETQANAQEAQKQERVDRWNTEETQLKSKLGTAYDNDIAVANQGAQSAGFSDDVIGALRDSIGMENTVNILTRMQSAMREDSVNPINATSPHGKTKAQLVNDKSTLMSEISADPTRLANYTSGQGSEKAKIDALNQAIYGM